MVLNLLDSKALFKKRSIRSNQGPFMNKEIRKAIMVRSRLKNGFLKDQTPINRQAYKKQRNFCVKFIRKSRKNYFDNLDIKNISDNRKFWKTVGPFFSSKKPVNENISLWENNELMTDEKISRNVY